MTEIPLGLSLSLIATIQLISATAGAQMPPAPPPPAGTQVAPTPPAPAPYPPPPAPAQYPPPPAFTGYPPNPAAPSALSGPGPVVNLVADNPRARLQLQNQLRWEDVCVTPCGRPVDPSGIYRVGGGTITPSPSFHLSRPEGQLVVQARTGSKIKRWVGFGLGMGGVGSAAVGGLYLALASSTNSTEQSGTKLSKDTARTFGITYLIIGGILMLIGFPMFAMNNTSVEVR
ncbi:MAG: hypothetical protein QOI66_1863 [Myxococcales bacterium]|jgi:hypothetical protein|nr:hypothetical protein [Myxococcales bacterium]